MEVILRDEALAQGYPRYYTGQVCRKGHTPTRYAANKTCTQCVDQQRAEKTAERHAALRQARQARRARLDPLSSPPAVPFEIIGRVDAKAKGLSRYCTGLPCPRGHAAQRFTSGRGCIDCLAIIRAEKRIINKKKRHAKRPELGFTPEQMAARIVGQQAAAYQRARAKLTAEDRVRINTATAEWAKKNPAKTSAKCGNRRAKKLKAMPAWADRKDIESFYRLAKFMGEVLPSKFEVDHIIPLQHPDVCGLHVSENLQVITSDNNRRKSNHFDALRFTDEDYSEV
jgi:hypothetical protein